jgi:hypothetical protein
VENKNDLPAAGLYPRIGKGEKVKNKRIKNKK